MAVPDRSPLRRRLAWLAASFALLALAAAAIWLARPDEPAPAPAPIAPAPTPAQPPPAPVSQFLTQDDLVAAVSAALQPPLSTVGAARPPAVSGRRFEVTLPVRCPEALGAAQNASLTYNYDTAQGALTLIARPQAWQDTPLPAAVAPREEFEAVEGFWISPLSLAAPTCARSPTEAASADAEPPPAKGEDRPAKVEAPAAKVSKGDEGAAAQDAAPAPRIGLATFFPPGASRTAQRRERPFRVTRKAPPPAGAAPYNLILTGRVVAFNDGPVIRCHAAPDQPLACLVTVRIDRVAFADAATGEVLAEWDG